MGKISTIFILALGALFGLFFSGCESPKYTISDIPQTMTGFLRIERGSKDFRFKFCDINNNFIAYVDTSEVVTSSFDRLVNNPVILRGRLAQTEKGKVVYADNIKLAR
ncbi:MAG: hypothetical protein J6P03_02915 [Opitutales bacterium]|nr:hypothetical protein [Opitutales bacterium]